MKRTIRIIVPVLLVLAILLGSAWYLFVYDRALTINLCMKAGHYFERSGRSKLSSWFYDRAYDQAGDNDEVAINLANQYIANGNYTQAERILQKSINSKPTTKLYTKLCEVFVKQDKVLDAVQLLDNVRDPKIISELNSLRPSAPTASLESGSYNQYIDVTFKSNIGTLYVNTAKEYPSIHEDVYTDPIKLVDGENHIYAIAIADNGLVSPLSMYAYTILDVIEQVRIQDSLMDAAIRTALGYTIEDTIYTNDLWSIETLALPEGVKDYSELAHIRSLKELTINGGNGGDLSVLQNLTQLHTLSISNINLTDEEIAIIGNLPALEYLTLSKCGLGTTAGLENAKNLQTLDLSNNTIRSIDSLQHLTGLKKLVLYRNVVEDLSPLASCTSLSYLDISFNALTTLSPIYKLSSLNTLYAEENEISEIAFTEHMSNLEYLSLAHNNITDVSSIAACNKLIELNISSNTIHDLSPLSQLYYLTVLNFANNNVSAIPSFDSSCALTIIDGSNNQITNLSPLSGLPHLSEVIMDNNSGITSVDDLQNCPSLTKVSVLNTSVASVGSLTERGIVVIK